MAFSARVVEKAVRLGAATVGELAAAEARAPLVATAGRPAVYAHHLDRWARRALEALRVEVRLEGALPPRTPGRPRLVLANHRAFVDIPLFLHLFGGHHLSRADVAGWPVVGRAARRIGTVFVDRADRSSGAAAIRALRRGLAEGKTLLVFPEGGTFAGDEVRPFRGGALVAARGVPGVELVPVGVAYPGGLDWEGVPFGAHFARVAARAALPVGVAVGAPRAIAAEASRRGSDALAALRDEVQALVAAARRVVE